MKLDIRSITIQELGNPSNVGEFLDKLADYIALKIIKEGTIFYDEAPEIFKVVVEEFMLKIESSFT